MMIVMYICLYWNIPVENCVLMKNFWKIFKKKSNDTTNKETDTSEILNVELGESFKDSIYSSIDCEEDSILEILSLYSSI